MKITEKDVQHWRITRIHVEVELLVVVQPDLREPGCVGRQSVHLGTEAPGDGMGCAVSIHMPDLQIKRRLDQDGLFRFFWSTLKLCYICPTTSTFNV